MTHIEQAIKEAMKKGGYDKRVGLFGIDLFYVENGDVLLDPLFWQALGKVRKWGVSNSILTDFGEVYTSGYLYYWHRFIEHLASGKDAESFFKELLT